MNVRLKPESRHLVFYGGGMKTIFGPILSFIVISAVVSGCSNGNADAANPTGKTFVASELTVDGVLTSAAPGGAIALTFTQDGISVIAGCNTMFGVAMLADGVLTVPAGNLASTMMACAEMLMEQDQALITFFTSNPSYTLDGLILTLASPTTTIVMTEASN
jgi:heat shock protein HslJ